MNHMYKTNIVKSYLSSECTVQYTGKCTYTEHSEKTEDESIMLRLKYVHEISKSRNTVQIMYNKI